jgi:glycosyltransferase involved in cell wall biosynthesis
MNQTEIPLATLVLFSYNQECYIKEAVLGALAQEYSPLKIVLSDDYSNDNTFKVIEELVNTYKGPHQVECRRNNQNLGLIGHVNLVMDTITTELVVVSAGDDISLPHRVSKIVDAYLRNEKPQLIFSTAFKINHRGTILEGEAPGQMIELADFQTVLESLNAVNSGTSLYLGASGAWSKDLWTKYGSIKYKNCFEDLVMGFRGSLENSFFFINEPLLYYRVGVGITIKAKSSIREKITFRKNYIKLKMDIARQRYVDLLTFHGHENLTVFKVVNKQNLLYKLTSQFYDCFSCFLLGCLKFPNIGARVLVIESKYFIGCMIGRN